METTDTLDALKDIVQFEERLQHNYHTLKRVRHDILKRWRVMAAITVCMWLFSKCTPFDLLFSCLFYAAISVFVVLVGVTLRSGRWLSAEQFREDAQAALLPFNLTFDVVEGAEGTLNFSKRVPADLHRLVQVYRREYHKRKP